MFCSYWSNCWSSLFKLSFHSLRRIIFLEKYIVTVCLAATRNNRISKFQNSNCGKLPLSFSVNGLFCMYLYTILQVFDINDLIHTCEPSGGSIFLPILRVPPVNFQNLPPMKKIKYNKILTYIQRSIFLEIPYLELPC